MEGILLLFLVLGAGGLLFYKRACSWRLAGRFGLNMLAAFVVLGLLEVIGEFWGFHLPINWPSVLLLAILGLPGLVLLAVLNFLLV